MLDSRGVVPRGRGAPSRLGMGNRAYNFDMLSQWLPPAKVPR